MKVLSIKEPFASLIKEQKKCIETRSWKTNYRGEIYIHASLGDVKKERFNNKDFNKIIRDVNYNPGYIICKCNLVDCIYMTKEYIENLKKDNYQEYLCGHYEEGRYSWVLEDVEEINPIKAKGQLGIWNYYKPKEVLELMTEIEYYDVINKSYKLQSPKDILKSKKGICWDQVELERYYLKNNETIKTYFIVNYDDDMKTHTFLTYKENDKYYWLEHAWEKYSGIHEYKEEIEMLKDIKEKYIDAFERLEEKFENLL